MDNFMKNKELLKNNIKSSELRQNSQSHYGETAGSVHIDKLAEMKKRLDMLRSQKF
jgi:hypothetical protein